MNICLLRIFGRIKQKVDTATSTGVSVGKKNEYSTGIFFHFERIIGKDNGIRDNEDFLMNVVWFTKM